MMRVLVVLAALAVAACAAPRALDCPVGASMQVSEHLYFGTATPDGVVGRINRTGPAHSDVMLITDPESKIAVEVARTRAPGILAGEDEDTCTVHIPSDFPVQVGDIIQTSGVDELFPRGQPVGSVVRVEEVVGGQQRVQVVPAVRFDRLDMVWVVLASAPPPDPSADTARKPPLAAGLGPLK